MANLTSNQAFDLGIHHQECSKISNQNPTQTLTVRVEDLDNSENPLTWPRSRKWVNVLLISVQAMLTPVASTLPAIAASAIATDLHVTSSVTPTLPVALFVLGIGVGPLFLAPLSETYGRRQIYLISFGSFTIINVGCSLAPDIASLGILRFLSGVAGSAGQSLGGASIGDMFSRSERGRAQALYNLGPTGGPVLGGVISGFILDGTGSWRWLMWVTVIAPGFTTLLSALFLRETYAPVIKRRKAKRLQEQYPDRTYLQDGKDSSACEKVLQGLLRPLKMLFTSPICASMAIYVALVYAILYLHILSLGLLFGQTPQYGLYTYAWNGGTTGLAFLGVGLGIIIGSILSAKFSDKAYLWMENRRRRNENLPTELDVPIGDGVKPEESSPEQGSNSPESRILMMQIGMVLIPLGLIIFAWTAARTIWVLPLLGAAIFATGMLISWVAVQIYMVDVFGKFAASALATTTILRSILGCIFSVVGLELYRHLGYAWGTMLLAFLCIVMVPLPTLLYTWGPKLRQKQFA